MLCWHPPSPAVSLAYIPLANLTENTNKQEDQIMAILAFIGLGNMVNPMATNLLKVGHNVTVFDRLPKAYSRLQEAGAAEIAV